MKSEYMFLLFGISANVLFFLIGYLWCKINYRETDESEYFSTKKSNRKKSNKNMKLV